MPAQPPQCFAPTLMGATFDTIPEEDCPSTAGSDWPGKFDQLLAKRNGELLRGIEKRLRVHFDLLRAERSNLQAGSPLVEGSRLAVGGSQAIHRALNASSGSAASESTENASGPASPRSPGIQAAADDSPGLSEVARGSGKKRTKDLTRVQMMVQESYSSEPRSNSKDRSNSKEKQHNEALQLNSETSSNSKVLLPKEIKSVHEVMRERGITSEGSAIKPSHERDHEQESKRKERLPKASKSSSGRPGARWRQQVHDFVESSAFNLFFTAAVLTNCLLIGIQIEYAANNPRSSSEAEAAFFVLSTIYTVIFTVEFVLKVLAYGMQLFCASSWLWNALDLFIVVTSLADLVITAVFPAESAVAASTQSTGQLRVIRILRIARLARVVRIMRVVRALRALRTLIFSILVTMKSLFWALVLVALLIYLFGILFTDAVIAHLADHPAPWETGSTEWVLHKNFGTLHKSMHSLFRSITGGLTWDDAVEALAVVNWIWAYLFTAYVAFSLFAVLNVMTGVFCQSALESAQRDQEMAIQNVILNRQRFEDMLMDLFNQIDDDGSGRITILEFEEHFEDEAFKCLLHSLELEVEDAWTLFMMLDQDGNHDIDAEEFLDGCLHLKGNAKAIELAKVKRKTDQIFDKLSEKIDLVAQEQSLCGQAIGSVMLSLERSRTAEMANGTECKVEVIEFDTV